MTGPLMCINGAIGERAYKNPMADSAETIRRRIEHFRSLLAAGASTDFARMYLAQIAKDHAALREIEQAAPKPDSPSKS